MGIAQNLQSLLADIAQRAQAVGRNPESIRLVAVSKTHPVSAIAEAFAAGQGLFGENRVQELCTKQPELPPEIQWHLIGSLQTNKVKYIAPFVSLIHSVDSEKLLQEIDRRAQQNGRIQDVLIQVNISSEDQKSGVEPETLSDLLTRAAAYPHTRVRGLMGMASFTGESTKIRSEFRLLRSLQQGIAGPELPANVTLEELSMGMSGDYPIAIEEGATLLRIGTAVFGAR